MIKQSVVNQDRPICVDELLIASVGCGNSQLEAELRKKISLIISMNNGCNSLNDYLMGQMQLVEHGLMFTRGMIDIARSRSQAKSTQLYVAENKSNSNAQRVTQSKNCQFSDTSSYQQFQRNDEQHSNSESQADSWARGQTWTNSWNLGRTWASGYSNINDWSYSTVDGIGHGDHNSVTVTYGQSFTRTDQGPGPQKNDIQVPDFSVYSVISGLIDDAIAAIIQYRIDINWGAILSGGDGFLTFQKDPSVTFNDVLNNLSDQIANGFVNPGCRVGSANFPSLSCCCDTSPSLPDCQDHEDGCEWASDIQLKSTYARGYNVNYNLVTNVPILGDSITVNWSDGEQFSQRHIISKMCSNASMLATTTNEYEQTDYAETYGRGRTFDENHARNDAHVISRSRRDSASDTTAGSATTGDSLSTSESGSDQKAHVENSNTGTGTRYSTMLSTSRTTNRGTSESKSEITKWGQVFNQLNRLWLTIMEEIRDNRLIASQSVGAAIGKLDQCSYSIPSDPIINSKIRSINAINYQAKPPYN